MASRAAGNHRLEWIFVAFAALNAGIAVVLRRHAEWAPGAGIMGFAALAALYWAVRRTLRRLAAITTELAVAADQVAAAAGQLASASQSLAQGVSAQSASLDESCGTSELMVSIMRQSAASGHDAGEMVRKADGLVSGVAESLKALVASSEEPLRRPPTSPASPRSSKRSHFKRTFSR